MESGKVKSLYSYLKRGILIEGTPVKGETGISPYNPRLDALGLGTLRGICGIWATQLII